MTISDALLSIIGAIPESASIPCIRELALPQPQTANTSKYAKFGLVVLEDNSAGFFYRLDDAGYADSVQALEALHKDAVRLIGQSPVEVARKATSKNVHDAAIGIAAINAVTQFVFKQADYIPPAPPPDSVLSSAQTVGLVGYFRPLVERLLAQNKSVVVLELNKALHTEQERLMITGDYKQLGRTEHIICTASTLINRSLDDLLIYADGRAFELIGPTCGCFCDPLFTRGITTAGGSRIVNLERAIARVRESRNWGDSVVKYAINPDNYPGIEALSATL